MSAEKREPRLYRLSQLAEAAKADATERYQAQKEGRRLGPVTGIPQLDLVLGNALHVGVHTLHGSPASGKTALALQIAATCECPSLVVSCEMRPVVLMYRLAARVNDCHLSRYQGGYLHPEIVGGHLQRVAETAPNLAIADGTEGAVPMRWIADAAASVRGNNPHLLLVVDSLHSWAQVVYPDLIEYDALNQGFEQLRQLTAQHSFAVLVVCERNRGAMKEGGLSASAGSRKAEYVGESVLGLDAACSPPNENGERPVKLSVLKNRNGEDRKIINLLWRGSRQSFREMDAP